MEEKITKMDKCRFCFPDLKKVGTDMKFVYHCSKKECEFNEESFCEGCKDFSSRYIEYPIEVSKINTEHFSADGLYSKRIGEIVKVRPCGKEYKGKTFVGILLGDLIVSPHISHDKKTNELNIGAITNPAIFVPELKKIIYGYESWWGTINNKDDLSDLNISDDDIQNTWYVKLLHEMYNTENKQS